MAGYAFAAKYTMFVMVPYALFFVAWRTRRLRPVAIAAAGAVLTCAPWLIKNWIFMHDPVAPFFTRVFPSPYLHTLIIEEWEQYLHRYDVPNLWALPLEVTGRGGLTQGIIGPIFLLAPLGLLALRDRAGRRVLFLGVILLATYFGNLGTRFMIPCLPFFALAMAIAVERWKPALVGLALIQAVAAWPAVMPLYANQYAWRLEDFPWRAALRIMPQEEFLKKNLFGYEDIKMIDEHVPTQDKVLDLVGVPESYTTRHLIQTFPGAQNNNLMDFLDIALSEDWQPRRAFVFHFPEQRTQRIRIVQTAQGTRPEQWNVHELRFYSRGAEIVRNSAWRIRAWPNPWDIQYAFDNSDATRWRSWQTGEPGMFIDVNFGRDQEVDEIRMFTSTEYRWPMQFEVHADGGRKIASQVDEVAAAPHGFLPRAATFEIYSQGIRYILLEDTNRLADEFAENPEGWNIQLVARTADTSLYKVLP